MTRCGGILFVLCGVLLAVFGGAPAPASSGRAGKAKARRLGSIGGRVAPGGARSGSLRFQVDGVRRRPRLRGAGFLLTGIPAGVHTLSVLAGGSNSGAHVRVTVRARATTQVGTLALEPGGQIAGLVSKETPESGEVTPLPGVEVVAECAGPEPLRPEPVPPAPPLVALTDETGAYAFRAVPPGPYRVSVVVPGLEAGLEFVVVTVGRTAVADFPLREAIEPGVGTVQGEVSDPDGHPIPGALVQGLPATVYRPKAVTAASRRHAARAGRAGAANPKKLPREEFSTLTDDQGRYALSLPAGRLDLSISAEGFLPASRTLTLRRKQTVTVDEILEPEPPAPTGVVEGAVSDAESGKPLQGTQVTLLLAVDPGGEAGSGGTGITVPPAGAVAFTDERGHYRIEGVPAGTWPVQAEAEGYSPDEEKVQVSEDATSELDFKLQAAPNPPPPEFGSVAGFVFAAESGQPLEGATVEVLLPYAGPPAGGRRSPSPRPPVGSSAVTDAKGHYRIDQIPAGLWQVSAGKAGYDPSVESAKVAGGETRELSFKLMTAVGTGN